MSLTARNKSCCWVCEADIESGASVKPITAENGVSTTTGRKKISWVHFDCISSDDVRIPICKHYNKSGHCIYQDICSFRHPIDHIPTNSKSNSKSDSNSSGTTLTPTNGDKEDRSRRGTWQRRRVYNHGKAGALRRWLINVFGEEYLSSGSGILDIAGGKGEVSFELVNLNNIPCTVIDPRALDLDRFERKYSREFYHKNAILGKYNSKALQKYQEVMENGHTVNVYNIRLPMHIPPFFHMEDIDDRCKDCCYMNSSLITASNTSNTDTLDILDKSDNVEIPEIPVDIMKTEPESKTKTNTGSNNVENKQSLEKLVNKVNTLNINRKKHKNKYLRNNTPKSLKTAPVFLETQESFQSSIVRSRNTAWTIKGLVDVKEDIDITSVVGESDDESYSHMNMSSAATATATEDLSLPSMTSISTGKTSKKNEKSDTNKPNKHVSTYNVKTYKPEHSSSNGSSRVVVENKDNHEVVDYHTACSIVRNCSIVIGMHPDQATEHMIEFALRNNKPFAILPCCIYSRQFPTRFNKSGKLVTTYGDFVEYLMEKYKPSGSGDGNDIECESGDGGIQAVEMDFEGKNILLYYTGTGNSKSIYQDLDEVEALPTVSVFDKGAIMQADAEDGPIAVSILQNPKQPEYRVIRGEATKELWQRLSDGMVKNNSNTVVQE